MNSQEREISPEERERRARHHRIRLLICREEYAESQEILRRSARGSDHLLEYAEFLEYNRKPEPAPA